MPKRFNSKGGLIVLKDKITTPDTLTVNMEFDEFPLTWQHRLWGSGGVNPDFNNGIFFYGEKATLFASDRKIVIMPAGRNQEQEVIDIPGADMGVAHMANFIDAVKKKDKNLLSCPIEEAFQSTSTVQLAMISYYTNSQVDWDQEHLKIVSNPQASELLEREYRSKYKRPSIG